MLGIVESTHRTFAHARDGAWRRVFVHETDCVDGVLPDEGETIDFEIDLSDERGPRARDVSVLAGPAPDIERLCQACGASFAIDALQAAWFTAKQLQYPVRCDGCRKHRQRW